MAFFSKVGNILKQSVSRHTTSQFSAPNPSIYQALRCMSSSKLFIGGLPWAVDDTSLRETFSQYGQVVEARVIVDREQNRSRGFGFVTFASTEEASSAIQAMDGQDLQGRTVRVNYATERAPRPFGGGGGYGGGGGFGGGGYGGGGYGGGGYGGGGYGGGQNYGGGGYGGGQNYGGGGYGGGQNYGGGGYGGGRPDGFSPSGGYGDGGGGGGGYAPSGSPGFGGGSYGVAGGVGGSDSYFGGGAAGSNPTAETGFGSSGLEDGSADQFDINSGDLDKGPLEENFRDDDEPNDFAKRA